MIDKIITFNLRLALAWNEQEDESVAVEVDGNNKWENRKDTVATFIERARPEVICFQELQPKMSAYLAENIPPTYAFCGSGRLAKTAYFDEMTQIAYDKTKLVLLEESTFWLSPTPSVPESKFEGQTNIPRIYTKAKFKSLENGEEFFVYNTHFDLNESVIQKEYEMLEEMIFKTDTLSFLCGDLNATPNKIIGEYNRGLYDLTEGIEYSYNGYGQERKKIDYVLCNQKLKTNAYIQEIIENGVYISDHYPVVVEIE